MQLDLDKISRNEISLMQELENLFTTQHFNNLSLSVLNGGSEEMTWRRIATFPPTYPHYLAAEELNLPISALIKQDSCSTFILSRQRRSMDYT